ncbi:MAG TPA: hypothetical protein VH042_04020 [Solirubrobacterales bacterium]|nr:hypothetical protein [Solirubrobacterales bacterium]
MFSTAVAMALVAPGAWAGPGYQLDPSDPSISLGAEIPTGVAIDQDSEEIYVAELTKGLLNLNPGEVEQLDSSGAPTGSSPFSTGGQDFFFAVAVNPVTHGIYAYQSEGMTPFGQKGASKMSSFSSSGVLGASFSPTNSAARTLAADSSGRVYFPNSSAHSVQVFNSTGVLESTITCGDCPGGGFSEPVAVAFNAAGKLYVVDSDADRVVKLTPSAGSYAYESTLQSGAGATAIAVDTMDGTAFVGDVVGSKYHVVAYDSTGTELDDFGSGLIHPSLVEAAVSQLAVNAATHEVYLSDPGAKQLWVFERIASIPAPTAAVSTPSLVGQLEATLSATVNPKGHVLKTCSFEYTNHADFLANGYANAKTAACPPLVGGPEAAAISAVAGSLTPGTSYDYRIQIGNHGGSAESGPQGFETLPPLPPEATTETAKSITKTTATLAASVNPKGGKISNCHFEYIDEAGFQKAGFTGAASKNCTTIPKGNVATAVTANVSALAAGTTYRFRVVATNNAGVGTATDKAFATVAETCAENTALCLPAVGGTSPPPTTSAPVVTPPSAPQTRPLNCRKGFKKKRVRGKLKCVKAKKHRSKR